MGFCVTQEAGFEIPGGWQDATMNVLEYARPSGVVRVALTRTDRGSKDLAAMTEERLVEQRRTLPFYELLSRGDRLVSGMACIELSALFEEATQKMYQRTLGFVLGSRLLVLGVAGPLAHRDEMDAIFDRAVGSLALRQKREG